MADRTAISFAFTPAAGGDSESRWVRIEQVETRGEMATMADAARFIDSLFDVDPCQKGEMGVGGQAVPTDEQGDPQDIPEEDTFVARAQQALDLSFCNPGDFWAAEVDVLRSHQSPGYVLKSDSCRIGPATVVQKTVSESFELDGASSIDLQWPYLRGLQISGSTVAAEVRGSTVNFAAPVSGSLLVQYQTVFDRVRIDVPRKADTAGNGQAEAEVASVLVFWPDFASGCDLQPPSADDSLDAAEIARLCRKPEVGYGLGGEKKCFETVEHYSLCNCSRRRVNPRREAVPAVCPEGVPPGTHYIGTRSVLAGYVWCEGEEDEVSDPEYYKQQCCTPPPGPLPRCRKTYSPWRGGAEIEGGAAAWTKIYGSGVRLIPISPPDGICGEQVVAWNVDSKNCCDDVDPLKPHPDNPTTISPGSNVILEVVDGKDGPLKWRASAGLYFEGGQNVLFNGARRERVYASHDICPNSVITVDDTCYPVALRLTAPASIAEMEIVQQDAIIAPGGVAILEARGGVPPYRWAASGLIIEWESATQAQLRAPANACGTYTVTATDPCGQIAQAEIRATAGKWVEQPIDDICHLPGRGKKLGIAWYWRPPGDVAPIYLPVVAAGGWRAAIYRTAGIATPHQGGAGCTNPGSCADGYAVSGGRCWAGNELLFDEYGNRIAMYDPADDYDNEFVGPAGWPQDEHQRALSWYCKHRYGCWYYGPGPKQTVNEWHAGGDEVVNFWRWVCP